MPPYISPNGWFGLDPDAADINWKELGRLVFAGYRLVAPKRLAAEVSA